jgi:ribosomal protein S18 acetylase RimI-like enzyme
MTVSIISALDGITPDDLAGGFFVGWPSPPTPPTHLRILHGSRAVALAIDDTTKNVVGFATALGDGVLTAYIPLLEVLPDYQGLGLGTKLVESLIHELSPCYMIDVCCDDDVVPFYERLNFAQSNSMLRRDYSAQAGRTSTDSDAG